MLNFLSTLIKPRNDEEVKAERGFNPYLLSKIQPQGGIKFESGYVKTGDGYISCIHVYKYQSLVSDFWLEELMRIEHAVVTLDVATADKKEIIESINIAQKMAHQIVAKEQQFFFQSQNIIYKDINASRCHHIASWYLLSYTSCIYDLY